MSIKSTKSMWYRMICIILVITVGFFGAASINLFRYMIIDSEKYKALAAQQQLQDIVLSAKRGDVYDRNGETLATSATAWTVYITPQDIKTDEERETIAKGLSKILDVEYDKILGQTKKSTYYEKIVTAIENEEAEAVRKFISENKLGSIVGLDETTKRYYPNDSLASTVLGFVGTDNQGLAGLEAYYDEQLRGTAGRVIAAKNATGADMPFTYEKVIDAVSGYSLKLTIDKYIQYVAEKYLEEAVVENNVTQRGCVIVMDPNTGEVYAMATKPDYNLNSPFTITDAATLEQLEELKGTDEYSAAYSAAQQKQWRNKAISDTYEPGSVFKIITGSAAIEEKAVTLASGFSCPGYIVIAGTRYNCHKHSGHGSQILADAFANSCNPAFIQIGQNLGTTPFFKYFQAFGMTAKTGIDLPGETSPVGGVTYHEGSSMSIVDLASESFGQGFNVTPIQLITAVSAGINGGYLVQPHLVSEIKDSDDNVKKSVQTVTKRQVISKETSTLLCSLLENVVVSGSGKNAYVAGYHVGGKTGTSQKLAGDETARVASFCGFAPAYDPQVVVLVVLDEPHGGNIYGGTIAAPVAGKILADILPYMGVEPQYTAEEIAALDKSTPDVIGQSVSSAKSTIEGAGLKCIVVGNGGSVERQVPSKGQSISKGGTVVIYTGSESATMRTVPNFTGMTVSAVNELAGSLGLNIKFSGNSISSSGAVAYAQDYAENEEVEIGTIITVSFRLENGSD